MLLITSGECLRIRDGLIWERSPRLEPEIGETVHQLGQAEIHPGLWDHHLHLLHWARLSQVLDLTECSSREELLQRVREWPGPFVCGQGWNEARWSDARWPSAEELGPRPVFLTRSDLHCALVNRASLDLVGLQAGQPIEGGKVQDNAVFDKAMLAFQHHLPQADRASLERVVSQLHAWGIVGVVDQRIFEERELHQALPLYRGLPLRIHCNLAPEDLPAAQELGLWHGFGDDWLRLGHVKFFSDGSLGARTARFIEPYQGEQQRGLWLTPPELLREGFARAHQAGFPISVHAIGDEAVLAVIEALEAVGCHPSDRIEHLQYLHPEWAQRLARLGVTASMQPVHMLDDRVTSETYVGSRSCHYYRLQTLLRAGVKLVFGSDAPVASANPWLGMQAAVERGGWYPQEGITLAQARSAYGSLWSEPNWADLVVLEDGQVRQTWVGGRLCYDSKKNAQMA
jgi:predicted amidohydrolase YtcJ